MTCRSRRRSLSLRLPLSWLDLWRLRAPIPPPATKAHALWSAGDVTETGHVGDTTNKISGGGGASVASSEPAPSGEPLTDNEGAEVEAAEMCGHCGDLRVNCADSGEAR